MLAIDKLINGIKEKNAPIAVGLDPKFEYIPNFILEKNKALYGETIECITKSFYDFNVEIINNIYDLVPAIKPQIAMYEMYGYEGIKCYQDTIKYAKEKGLIIIGDVKRGDISSTATCYAKGHIGEVDVFGKKEKIFDSDFCTINAYMGGDSIEPFIEEMKNNDTGVFVLLKTSNKGSKDIQDIPCLSANLVFEEMGKLIECFGKRNLGEYGYSSVGAVVGGTHKEECIIIRNKFKNTFFLIPGYGAQGGKAENIKACFDNNGLGGIVVSARGIILAYKNLEYDEKDFGKASRQAVVNMIDDLKNNGIIK